MTYEQGFRDGLEAAADWLEEQAHWERRNSPREHDRRRLYEHCEAAIRALVPAGAGWCSDMNAAPKDGTRILGYSLEYGQRETFMRKYEEGSIGYAKWAAGDGPIEAGWDWSEPKSNWLLVWEPTHWRPLPTPPEESDND